MNLKLIFSFLILSPILFAKIESDDLEPINEVFEPKGTFDPSVYGKVAVVAWNNPSATPLNVTDVMAENFKQRNRMTLESYIRTAASTGAKLVLTPEFAIVGYPDIPQLPDEEDNFRNREDVKPYVETVPGASSAFFGKLASELKIFIHVGIAERDSVTDEYFNTVIVLGPDGNLTAKYRKINLYQLEKNYLVRGNTPVVYQNYFGKMGIIVCSDVYSNFPLDNYANERVNGLTLSTSWAQMNSGMGYFQRAARRTNSYLLASNQMYFPDSGVVNPDGTTQSHIRQSSGIAYGFLPYRK